MIVANEFWAALPLAAFTGFYLTLRSLGLDRAAALARAAILWAGFAWMGANALGLAGALGATGLKIFWFVLAAGSGVAAWRRRGVIFPRVAPLRSWTRDPWEWCMALACLAVVAIAGWRAATSAPATIDVLSYHLPRQVMWLQQGSLAHFSTLNDRMLMMPPLSEVVGLQFMALTGGDYRTAFPQWCAYVGGAALTGAAVASLGAGRRWAWAGAWFFLSLPMAWHEAANAKNDLSGAFWILVVLAEVLRAKTEARATTRAGLWAGAAIGLALLNKSTAFVFLPPLIVAGAGAWLRAGDRRAAGRAVAVAAVAALALVAPFLGRNVAWYGTPLGVHRTEDGGRQMNEEWGPGAWGSNFLRVASQHFAGPWTGWNAVIEGSVHRAHQAAGRDVNDPKTTLWVTRYALRYAPNDETRAAAPWHLLLVATAAAITAAGVVGRDIRWLSATVVWMAAMFVWVLKWQPWSPRLQLPVFAVGVVLVAVCAARFTSRPWRRAWGAVIVVLGGVSLWVSWPTRAGWSGGGDSEAEAARETEMQRNFPPLALRDRSVAALIARAGIRETALLSVHDSVYPLMRKLTREHPGFRFVDGRAGAPESILACEHYRVPELVKTWPDGTRYRLTGDGAGDALYLREFVVRALGWQTRLPPFVGWTGSTGLSLAIFPLQGDGGWLVGHTVSTAAGCRVRFHCEESGRVWLELWLVGDASILSAVSTQVNGVEIEGTRREPGALEIGRWITTREGWNELTITCGDKRGDLHVLRLQICDEPVAPAESGGF